MTSSKRNSKYKVLIDEAERKMKKVDLKIKALKSELHEDVSSLKILKNQNMKIEKFMKKTKSKFEDQFIDPDILRYFNSLQDKLNKNPHFSKIIDVLKTEVYTKLDVKKLDEYTFLKCVTLPEKTLYSQWILQILTEKLSNMSDEGGYDSSLETMLYLRKIMSCCNLPIADVFPTMLNILSNTSCNILSDIEQDLLIFMHAVARMQSLFDLIPSFDIRQDRKLFLSSKTERFDLQRRQIQLLKQLKHFVDALENINVYGVFDAIIKSNDDQIKAEEMAEAYENFKRYVICVSGQTSTVIDSLKDESTKSDILVNSTFQKINFRIHHGTKESLENYDLVLKYDLFQEDVKNLIEYIMDFTEKMTTMSINDIEEARKCLTCLKVQVDFILQRKWDLQRHMIPFVCGDDKVLLLTSHSELLLEHIQDTMFNLKILEEIEFNKNFSIMSDLCQLRERKDLLILKFRHFISRIGYQEAKHIPIIKRELLDFNTEIQILLSDYHKLRFKLQYFNIQEEEHLQNMLEDIKSVIMTYMKADKKLVGFVIKRKINVAQSEAEQKRTKENLEEIGKIVDETVEFLHSLDEAVISKKFSALRYLCELHCLKEQIVTSFENLLFSIFELNTEDDEAIIERLNQLNSSINTLIGRYETIGAQLMLFSDVMEIVHKEKSEAVSCSNKIKVEEISETNVGDLFGTTDDLRKLHCRLDNAIKHKWFPAKGRLFEMLKDKEKLITSFTNFIDRMPELDTENTMEAIHSLRRLIIKAEIVLRRYQSLRLQLIWVAGECVFNIANT